MILSGSTPCNTTFLGDTRADIALNLIAILTANGWTVKVTNSSTDKVLESASTPAGQKMRLHIQDPGSGNCCKLMPQRASAGVDLQTHYLLPGATSTYRVIANPYQYFIFRDAVLPNAREAVCGVVPFCPPGVAAMSSDIFFAYGNGGSDTDSTTNPSPTFMNNRFWAAGAGINVLGGNTGGLSYSDATNPGWVLPGASSRSYGSPSVAQFFDNSFAVMDALMTFGVGQTGIGSTGFLVGWIWDAIILCELPGLALGTIRNFPIANGGANHQWYALSNNTQFQLALLIN